MLKSKNPRKKQIKLTSSYAGGVPNGDANHENTGDGGDRPRRQRRFSGRPQKRPQNSESGGKPTGEKVN